MTEFTVWAIGPRSAGASRVFLLGGLIGGWGQNGFWGAILGLIGAFLMSVVFFGALFVLLDISDHTRRTAEALERQNP